MSLTTEIKAEVHKLIKEGKKTEAIQLLCDRLKVRLQEASTLADAAEIEIQLSTAGTSNLIEQSHSLEEVNLLVKKLLEQDKKIEAIKLVREKEKLSLKKALRRVEAIEKQNSPSAEASSAAKTTRDPFNLVGKIAASIGILLAFTAMFIYYAKQNSIANSVVKEGYVVELIDSDGMYAPRIRYTWEGKKLHYQSNVYSRPAAYEVGERVQLFINRENPADVIINTFSGRWVAIIIVGGIGTFFFGFGLLFIFVSGKF